jgi:hypothetical protein
VSEAESWNPEVHVVLWVLYVTSLFDSALGFPKMWPMSEASLEDATMYVLFGQGLTGCTFVS